MRDPTENFHLKLLFLRYFFINQSVLTQRDTLICKFLAQTPAITMEDVSSVPAIAVTAAVGAVVLLFILLCNIGRKSQSEKGDKICACFVPV